MFKPNDKVVWKFRRSATVISHADDEGLTLVQFWDADVEVIYDIVAASDLVLRLEWTPVMCGHFPDLQYNRELNVFCNGKDYNNRWYLRQVDTGNWHGTCRIPEGY